jgi:membrane carboxypeptidase/penicillin-binding protein PbpC
MRANPSCPARINEWLPAGASELPCSWHHQSEEGTVLVWPPIYRQWAQQQMPRPDATARVNDPHPRKPAVSNTSRLAIVNPPQGALYLIDPTLRRAYQTLAFRASADREAGEIEWAVDGRAVGKAESDSPLSWPLTPGEHHIAARDARGRTAETSIVVR